MKDIVWDGAPLTSEEKLIFALRALYSSSGYSPFRMGKFEEYDYYARNKDFLVSDSVITFTDTDGRLLALKPDVTLSIIKNSADDPGMTRKVFYNENVYRVDKRTGAFREIPQTGVEAFGKIDEKTLGEVILLAAKSLSVCAETYQLVLSDLDMLSGAIDGMSDSPDVRKQLFLCAGEKNFHGIGEICEKHSIPSGKEEDLKKLLSLYGDASSVLPEARKIFGKAYGKQIDSLEKAAGYLESNGEKLTIDFSIPADTGYYNGIVFKGYVEGIAGSVLSGGRYDRLMKKLGKNSKAVGFALYLDLLNGAGTETAERAGDGKRKTLNVALPKGRLGEKVYAMFEKAGFGCPSILDGSRKLIFENPEKGVRFFWVKPSDVAIYVERGAADIGVAGKDILLEYGPDVFELLDLNVGICRMAVAAPKGWKDDPSRPLRVATKFSRIAGKHFASKGREIDVIHLNGSIEIAPILGLSDVIVDIVETGTTLKENDLEVVEEIVPISARLIANKAGYRFKTEEIERLAANLSAGRREEKK